MRRFTYTYVHILGSRLYIKLKTPARKRDCRVVRIETEKYVWEPAAAGQFCLNNQQQAHTHTQWMYLHTRSDTWSTKVQEGKCRKREKEAKPLERDRQVSEDEARRSEGRVTPALARELNGHSNVIVGRAGTRSRKRRNNYCNTISKERFNKKEDIVSWDIYIMYSCSSFLSPSPATSLFVRVFPLSSCLASHSHLSLLRHLPPVYTHLTGIGSFSLLLCTQRLLCYFSFLFIRRPMGRWFIFCFPLFSCAQVHVLINTFTLNYTMAKEGARPALSPSSNCLLSKTEKFTERRRNGQRHRKIGKRAKQWLFFFLRNHEH